MNVFQAAKLGRNILEGLAGAVMIASGIYSMVTRKSTAEIQGAAAGKAYYEAEQKQK
jgi:hypothetical protein